MECEEEQPGGDWEVGGQLGGEDGNRGMEGCDFVGWAGAHSYFPLQHFIPPSLTSSLALLDVVLEG